MNIITEKNLVAMRVATRKALKNRPKPHTYVSIGEATGISKGRIQKFAHLGFMCYPNIARIQEELIRLGIMNGAEN